VWSRSQASKSMASHAPRLASQKDRARSKFKRRVPSKVEVPLSFLLFFSRTWNITRNQLSPSTTTGGKSSLLWRVPSELS